MQPSPAIRSRLGNADLRSERIRIALFVVTFTFVEIPLLIVFFRRLWENEHYRSFPFVLAVSACLIYSRWPTDVLSLRKRDWFIALTALVMGFVCTAGAVVLWSGWLAYAATLCTGLFLLFQLAGRRTIADLGSAWLLLWLILPLPGDLDRELVLSLQDISSRTASKWLDILNYNHVLSGHVIHVPSQKFVIEEACGGSHSFFVMLHLTAIFVAASRYPPIAAILLLLSTIGWAIFANSLRILSVVIIQANAAIYLSTGLGHSMVGIVTFVIALGFVFSTDRLLLFLLAPTRPKPSLAELQSAENQHEEAARLPDEEEPAKSGNIVGIQSGLARRIIAHSIFGVAILYYSAVGVAHLYRFVTPIGEGGLRAELTGIDVDRINQRGLNLSENDLPIVPNGWEFVEFKKTMRSSNAGTHSASWTFRRAHLTAILSLDFPFLGWHELSACYMIQGWGIGSRHMLTTVPTKQESLPTLGFDLEKPTGEFGHVLVALFDQHGTGVNEEPGLEWSIDAVTTKVMKRLSHYGVDRRSIRPVYQLQVFVATSSPLTDVDKQKISALYFSARSQIISRLREVSGQKSSTIGGDEGS